MDALIDNSQYYMTLAEKEDLYKQNGGGMNKKENCCEEREMTTQYTDYSTRHNVSIPKSMWDFIQSRGYSLSKLLRIKITEIMEERNKLGLVVDQDE